MSGEQNLESKRNQTETEKILKLLTRHGVIEDASISDDKIRAAQQKKQKVAYHNTELLLKQYKSIAWMVECFPDTIAEELEQPFENVDSIIDRLDLEMTLGNRKVENRLESVRKTRLLLDRVNDALSVLKRKPGDGERLYDLIYLTYIAPEALNLNDLVYRLNISPRHYYRMRDQAISILSIRLWSAPNSDLDFWLEILTAIDE